MEVALIESMFSAMALCVWLYRQAKDWHYVREVAFECNSDGNVDMYKLKEELGVDGNLQVCAENHTEDNSLTAGPALPPSDMSQKGNITNYVSFVLIYILITC